jgi:hypothetical protein
VARVNVRIPCAIISRTVASSAFPVVVSTALSDFTDTTRPGYGPGMPGFAAGAYFETTRSAGSPSGFCGLAAAEAVIRFA